MPEQGNISEENTIWTESVTMRDFLVKPSKWFWTICTVGLYPVFVFLGRISKNFTLTNERLTIKQGILSKKVDEIELFRIKDSKIAQTALERLVGIGEITVISSDRTGDLIITPITNPFKKREELRRFANEARDKRGVRTIEQD
jgi:uncharacterized membrane protein YdbT with pleckstrin-like domain